MSHFWETPVLGKVDGVQAMARMCQCGTVEFVNLGKPKGWVSVFTSLTDGQCEEYDRRVPAWKDTE